MTSSAETTAAETSADPAKLLKAWARVSAPHERKAALFGVIHHLAFVGFAWGAATAVSALVAGQSIWSGLVLALICALIRAGLQAGEARAGFEASANVRAHVRRKAAEALADRGPSFSERTPSGQTASALIDAVEKLDGYFGRYRPLLPVVALGPLVILIAAFTQSWVVGMIFMATGLFLTINSP